MTAQTIPEQIAAIIERFPDYHRSDEALNEAIAVWGAEGHVNDCGVFVNYERETVAKAGRAVADLPRSPGSVRRPLKAAGSSGAALDTALECP